VTTVEIRGIELLEVALPFVRPFRTSFGEERAKRAILVRLDAGDVIGWGECGASEEPRYSEEWVDGAWDAMRRFLGPAVMAGGPVAAPEDVAGRMSWVRGHRMAKMALEMAVLDAWLRVEGRSLSAYLGGTKERVACGVSVGIAPTVEAMLEEILGYVEKGYQRVKLKIEPGRDLEVVQRVRDALPDRMLSVDANAAYTMEDLPVFEALDAFHLLMVEQPLDHEDLLDHAALQRQIETAVCLDESIRSVRDTRAALDLGSCRIVNIKPGRVGGLLEAKRIHDECRARGVPVWIGGLLETGVGRAANLALASLPGVTLPGDTSASERYFAEDLTEPFVLAPDGTMAVPSGPGIGVEPIADRLARCTVRVDRVPDDEGPRVMP
jgi:o-succinylbenzoate synthase